MMKFVMWGAGYYGKRILKLLGTERVIAVIDSDKDKIGKTVENLPIISVDDYLKSYLGVSIIICVRDDYNIRKSLAHYAIKNVISALDLPPRVLEEGRLLFEDLDFARYRKDSCIGIYGDTLYGRLLYEYMRKKGYKYVSVINNNFQITNDTNYRYGKIPNIVLVTNRNFEAAALSYSHAIVDDIWDASYGNKKYKNVALEKFKKKHQGKRCFIVATGPSLLISDLDVLYSRHEITMSVNKIFRGFQQTEWRPDYYVLGDAGGIQEYGDIVVGLNLPNIFIADRSSSFWKSKKLQSNLYKYHQIQDRQTGLMRVSGDFVSGIYARATVIVECLQIAFYMGFKEIFLVGTDCDYQGLPNHAGNHFIEGYEDGSENYRQSYFPLEEALGAYQAIRHYAERHGIKIYNATRGGKLEVFERVDFDRLF